MSHVNTAVFPVGGLGTRFLPATKALPKEMLPVVDKPLIEYAVEEARDAGIEYFVFVTGRGKTAIENHFDTNFELETSLKERGDHALLERIKRNDFVPGRIAYVRQIEPMGLGHAVWCARHLIGDEPFAVLLADELIRSERPCLSDLIEVHQQTGGNVVSVMPVPRDETSRYGIVATPEGGGRIREVTDLVEKPPIEDAPSNLALIGRYVLEPSIMDHLDKTERGAGGEVQLTDALCRDIGKHPFHAVELSGRRYDCGTKVGYLEANVALALERTDLGGDAEAAVRRALGE